MEASGSIRYARNGDVSIAYRVLGKGPATILCIPGFMSHLEIAGEISLAQRFWGRVGSFARVIWFDKRGMGLSDREAGGYTLENIVDDALAVLDDAGMERVVAFGVSEGGPAATMLAAMQPNRVEAMVQYGTYARLSKAPDYPEGIPVERMRALTARMLENWGDPDTLKYWAPSAANDPELRDWWSRLLHSGTSPGGYREVEQMYEAVDVRPLLPGITVQTLVLYRKGDRIVPPPLSKIVAEGIPGARAVELPGEDHLFLAGDQDSLLDAIEEFVTGRSPTPAAERTLATVLFTDIVGSTERAAELGDRRWGELLEDHDRLARREVEHYRGRLVKSTGDGVLATFDGPARAVRSALSLRAAAGGLGLDLRAGIHTGECELRSDDVTGIAVHLAARVEQAAGPGDVLTSGTVKDLVVGSGLQFEDRGSQALKGIPGEWPLFAVTGDSERRR